MRISEKRRALKGRPNFGAATGVDLKRLVGATSLSGHQSARMKNDEWLTPPEILAKLGTFDLDPCSPTVRPWPTAKTHFALPRDGLLIPWFGRVWCNPPFGARGTNTAQHWLAKLANHGNGIALIPARTETAMFYDCVWNRAQAVCFLRGRPHFHRVDGTRAPFNSGAPICLVAYGEANAVTLETCGLGITLRCGPNTQAEARHD